LACSLRKEHEMPTRRTLRKKSAGWKQKGGVGEIDGQRRRGGTFPRDNGRGVAIPAHVLKSEKPLVIKKREILF